ncbi:MAG: biotin--[acetyl-CoA-carboxylase] ligase [Muribaculaceae bacterium]|nr:biotin--[acetyl-CoA-carboxylase] ligase [Muribaculaceae bacterium]
MAASSLLFRELPETGSTNSWLKENAADSPHGLTVFTHTQSAGRGQRGNSWEAEPGKNLTFSVMLRPQWLHASRQFAISQAVCCGVALTLARRLEQAGFDASQVKVKWPNDVYAGDRKIAGILIENSLSCSGQLAWSVAGAGVNINQSVWRSDAPNPVSLRQLTGVDTPLEPLLHEMASQILALVEGTSTPDGCRELDALYSGMLYRADGRTHPFFIPSDPARPVSVIPDAPDARFHAMIDGVNPDGALRLRHADGSITTHLFKEVSFVIS